MRFQIVLAAGLSALPSVFAITGKSYTGWDCCKPGCAWRGNLGSIVQGSPRVCDINNQPLSNGINATSGCDSNGNGQGFLCDSYTPSPTSETMAYGFATMAGNSNCCKCFQLTWTSGNARGKQMIVQAVNNFSPDSESDVKSTDIVILTPGGGSGSNSQGCRYQYGRTWGNAGGGVGNANDCAALPQNLQGGCYWRYNWANGGINGWNIDYQQVSCPSRLTSVSGCSV